MRALILSDIHANLEALTAVLEDADGAWDTLWNLGDVVGYGGSPNEVVDRVRPLSALTVRGNHDRVCCGLTSAINFNPTARAAAQWTQNELSADNLVWLRQLAQGPLTPELPEGESVPVTLAHGSPLNEDQYILNMRDAWAPLQRMARPQPASPQSATSAITFFGHTHVQGGFSQRAHDWHELRPKFTRRNGNEVWTLTVAEGTRHLINPGSVGQPRDSDWRAAYAIYDSNAGEIYLHRVAYDLTASQGRILMAGLPERLAARLREGR